MSWLDDLRPASLDGVPFHVRSSRVSHIGRDNKVFEAFRQDYATFQDVGRGIPRFSLESYLVGDNYHVDRQAFVRMLERPGAKVLEHPYWGRFTVVVQEKPEMEESQEFGGMVRFTLVLVEVGPQTPPIPLAASGTQYAAAAKQATLVNFNSNFRKPKGMFYRPMLAGMTKLVGKLGGINGKIAAATYAFSDFTVGLRALDTQLAGLLASPNLVAGAITSVITSMYSLIRRGVTSPVTAPGAVYAQAAGLSQVVAAVADDFMSLDMNEAKFLIPTLKPTPGLVAYQTSLEALENLFRTYGVLEAASMLLEPEVTFRSAGEAEMVRDKMVAHLGAILAQETLPVEMSLQIRNLRAELKRYLTEIAQRLPRMYTMRANRDVPAVVLAWELYGDIRRAEEIMSHNRLRDYHKIPAYTELEVLSDG